MSGKIEHGLEKFIFNSRWLLAPFFLGLVVSITLLLIKFCQELVHLSVHVVTATESDIIIGVLSLIDITLVGSLLLMIIFSGYEIFVSKIDVEGHEKNVIIGAENIIKKNKPNLLIEIEEKPILEILLGKESIIASFTKITKLSVFVLVFALEWPCLVSFLCATANFC